MIGKRLEEKEVVETLTEEAFSAPISHVRKPVAKAEGLRTWRAGS